MAHIKIEMTGRLTGKVWLDDVEVKDLERVDFSVGVPDCPARVTLVKVIYPETVEIEGEIETTILDNLGSRTFSRG